MNVSSEGGVGDCFKQECVKSDARQPRVWQGDRNTLDLVYYLRASVGH
uniref:Uncharacterized protein n=1 Tax=Setaria italica TaxID=4555 RepID=K3ZZ25_SETIT